ncbi:hypothetical protein ACFXO7_30755, partial [Nocardia tengchongensis]|uniref:hypothetical protein n=1 Tax=Nocardia tengchongensis TaxID=2055889 RepID=UPI0036BACA2C
MSGAPVTVATSGNRAGTVTVSATDQGLPVEIRFERSEYRYGAPALAAEILRLTRRSAIVARSRRRALPAAEGVPDAVLDRRGGPPPPGPGGAPPPPPRLTMTSL